MSYCRWSSMDFACDLYIYASVYDCWTIHVAGARYVGPLPDQPSLAKLASGEMSMEEYHAMRDRWSAWTEEHGTTAIPLPHAGGTFNLAGPGECADKVEELIALGYICPDYVVPTLREEQAELDAQGMETAKPPKREAGSARKGDSPVANGDAPKPQESTHE